MTTQSPVGRRTVLKGALAGTALAVAPLRVFDREAAAAPASAGVFGYGVASGDPTQDRVIIWTRATPATQPAPGSDGGPGLRVQWQVASDPGFTTIVRHGTVGTSSASDYTVKVDVTNLSPYTRYWYRFIAGGQTSPVGRTQTSPSSGVHALRFALVTCSNYTGGYFSAYRLIGERDDLDFVLHVGDYIYEYGNGSDRYGPAQLDGVRDGVPSDDLILLQDYRLRHAQHKADPDCALAHQQTPWITIFDDHEVANNTWATGAENQHPTTPAGRTEPPFLTRRAAAYQAYLEWMPFRYPVIPGQQAAHDGQQFFRQFTWGSLADLSVIETRQNRSAQIDAGGGTGGGGGFIDAHTAHLTDAGRHLPEPKQFDWLVGKVGHAGHRWHLVGNQVQFAPVRYPSAAVGVTTPVGSTAAINSDQWDGYPGDQQALLTALKKVPRSGGDAVFLTGDIHSSWANDLPATLPTGLSTPATPYTSVAVEFITPSVTSDGFYETVRSELPTGTPPEVGVTTTRGLTATLQQANPWVKYLDGVGHGYAVIDVTPARVQADYFLTPSPTTAQPEPRAVQSVVPAYVTSYQTVACSRRISAAVGPVGARSDEPKGAVVTPPPALPEHVGPLGVAAAVGVAGTALVVARRRAALRGEPAEVADPS